MYEKDELWGVHLQLFIQMGPSLAVNLTITACQMLLSLLGLVQNNAQLMEQLHHYWPVFYDNDVLRTIEEAKRNNSIIYAKNALWDVPL